MDFTTFIAGLNSLYDLGKDILNVDTHRSVEGNKELMDYQHGLNLDTMNNQTSLSQILMGHQYELNKLLQGSQIDAAKDMQQRQIDANKASQNLAQFFNEQNMSKQFAYNQYLSSVGRNIIGNRSNGINPSAQSAGGSGSVTAPSSTPLAASSPSVSGSQVGLGSVGALGASGNGKLTNAFSASQVLKNAADANLSHQQGENQAIRNKTELIRNLTELNNMRSAIARNESEATKLDSESKRNYDTLGILIQQMYAEIQRIDSETAKNIDFGRSSRETAKAASDTVSESIRWHDILANLQSIGLQLTERQVGAYESFVNNLGELQSEQKRDVREDADFKHMTRDERMQQLIKNLDLTDEQKRLIRNQADVEGVTYVQKCCDLFFSPIERSADLLQKAPTSRPKVGF